ncbi:hypothetical protein GCM10023264_21870 [Sphingomonas daechungensis]|uniref:YXWGXW repeat-containing protein n=1 Tax=Sphingomonas daechungensis TaxID=1176646 RepID=A0ABX6T2S0_9SPHN|nr:hypothetical protein [Sphingomonas daechungensis]QNP43724.1 hypothetical protein H9L15_03355 [Sphingomonas daechungensis]
MKTKLLVAAAGCAASIQPAGPVFAQPQNSHTYMEQSYKYGRYPYANYGYNQYGGQARAIDQCARAVEGRLNGYNYNWYQGQNYNRYRRYGRVEGITRVERKSYGFRVLGVASSGWSGYQGWNRPGYGTYGYHAGVDLKWVCKVQPNGRIKEVDVAKRPYNWRGY